MHLRSQKGSKGMTHSTHTQGHPERSRGMTAIELVIVAGIFSIVTSAAILNYKGFQGKVSLKNLANEIALQITEAQKSAISGKWQQGQGDTWRPAYGVAFNISAPTQFIYFADLDQSGNCTGSGCTPPYSVTAGGEVLSIITITGGSSIATSPTSGLEVSGSGCPSTVNNFSIVFKRPNTAPIFDANPDFGCTPTYLGVNIISSQSTTARVRVYASGRVQMN
jgi:Tfp pilus assembly protein FimT